MNGSITAAVGWDVDYEQRYLAVNPIGDEVFLYQTNHNDPQAESDDMIKANSRVGFNNIQCSSYNQKEVGVMGIGEINGTVCIFDIASKDSSILKLRPKQERPCNTLSFNKNDCIAAGFDKGRQDNSLQIWDIENYEHVGSPTVSYVPNEAVLSTAFDPISAESLLAGSYKFLREVDLRSEAVNFQMATKYTLGLSIDPFQPLQFLSYSEDGSLAIWDRRKLTSSNLKGVLKRGALVETPLLQFNKLLGDSSRKKFSPCMRHSTIRRGEFSAVFNGELIRRWHTGEVPGLNAYQEALYKPSNDNNILQSLKRQSAQLYNTSDKSLFVVSVSDVKALYDRVISFDYSPDFNSKLATNFVCMRLSGSVFRMPVTEAIESFDFNPYNEFTFSGPEGVYSRFLHDDEILVADDGARAPNLNEKADSLIDESEELESAAEEVISKEENIREDKDYHSRDYTRNNMLNVSDVMKKDICYTIRQRALMGYETDCEKNIKILESLDILDNYSSLRNTWKWISLAKKSLEKGTMISQGLDLGYQGVMGIWKGAEELRNQDARGDGKETQKITDQWFSKAVRSIVSHKGKTATINILSDSEKKAQRKLCLIVAGWYLTDAEFEEKLDYLTSQGQHEKAAGWAVFQGDVSKSVEILASSLKERLRLMATAVAGYLAYKSTNTNSLWKDQCRKMASDMDNPYLRAIFAFIADSDWFDVLDEHSLPLREKLGVALRFLSDKDLTVYVNRICDSVVARGEIEGLILTGITPKGIELVQSYVDRTNDVQTAALMTAFGSPRYFSNEKAAHWVSCYRDLLNSWGMFSNRARFDVARAKLSKNLGGQPTITPAPRQVFLVCSRCNKSFSKFKSAQSSSLAPSTPSNSHSVFLKHFNKLNLNSDKSIHACPYCGSPLPRCSVCLLSLAAPIPVDPTNPPSDNTGKIENKFREWFSFCLSCNHGAHTHHAEEWFSRNYVCPVPGCNCCCNSK